MAAAAERRQCPTVPLLWLQDNCAPILPAQAHNQRTTHPPTCSSSNPPPHPPQTDCCCAPSCQLAPAAIQEQRTREANARLVFWAATQVCGRRQCLQTQHSTPELLLLSCIQAHPRHSPHVPTPHHLPCAAHSHTHLTHLQVGYAAVHQVLEASPQLALELPLANKGAQQLKQLCGSGR